MSPAVAFLISELTKLAVQRIYESGKFDTLTQDEAEKMVADISASLSFTLPTPEDLEKGDN